MENTKLLQKIAHDVSEVKERVERIEKDVEEINEDLHEVRPEYLEKLKKIDSGRFLSRQEFEKELGD